jgi:hypothetical protein
MSMAARDRAFPARAERRLPLAHGALALPGDQVVAAVPELVVPADAEVGETTQSNFRPRPAWEVGMLREPWKVGRKHPLPAS